jgi:hypothetical protein
MREFNLFRVITAVSALTLAGSAFAGESVSIAGVYSAKHKVNFTDGSKAEINGYLSIAPDGEITAYGSRNSVKTGKECYFLVTKSYVNYALQGQTLVAGTAPNGERDYEVKLGQDRFGIFAEPDSKTGNFRWFYYRGADDATATVTGPEHTINTGNDSFSITGPRLASMSETDIRMQRCDER